MGGRYCVLMEKQKELIVLMGMPASGKSWIVNRRFAETHTVIDSDAIMATHADYDPKNPSALYHWAANLASEQMKAALESGQGNWVYDSTGTNAERLVRYINLAKANGMTTKLVYVTVSLETSLYRNSQRERVVPTEIIMSKSADIQTAYDIVSAHTDSTIIIENE